MKSLIITNLYSSKTYIIVLDEFDIKYNMVFDKDEAMDCLNNEKGFNLVIIDNNMTGLILTQLIQQIKEINSQIKIIVLANEYNYDFLNSNFINEVSHIIQKPFESLNLYHLLRKFKDEDYIY